MHACDLFLVLSAIQEVHPLVRIVFCIFVLSFISGSCTQGISNQSNKEEIKKRAKHLEPNKKNTMRRHSNIRSYEMCNQKIVAKEFGNTNWFSTWQSHKNA